MSKTPAEMASTCHSHGALTPAHGWFFLQLQPPPSKAPSRLHCHSQDNEKPGPFPAFLLQAMKMKPTKQQTHETKLAKDKPEMGAEHGPP